MFLLIHPYTALRLRVAELTQSSHFDHIFAFPLPPPALLCCPADADTADTTAYSADVTAARQTRDLAPAGAPVPGGPEGVAAVGGEERLFQGRRHPAQVGEWAGPSRLPLPSYIIVAYTSVT